MKMMKQQKQLYLHPTVKVVCFKVEEGFQSMANAVESESPNFETVTENTSFTNDYGNHDYGDYFTTR